jgi:hypothetical protein
VAQLSDEQYLKPDVVAEMRASSSKIKQTRQALITVALGGIFFGSGVGRAHLYPVYIFRPLAHSIV